MKRSVAAVVIALLFSVFTFPVLAQQGMGMGNGMQKRDGSGMGYGNQHFRNQMMTKLNLTDQQKDKISELKITHQKNMIDLKAQLQKDILGLKELRSKDDFNRNDVLSSVEKVNKSRDAIAVERANHMMDVYQILTPDQQKVWKQNAPMFNEKTGNKCSGMRMHRRMMK